jgi:glycosyltransferase involved in cell wall biosynthesis
MSVDGLDWERGKWGPFARAYLHSAAHAAVRWCTRLVTDAEAMRAYYRERFGRDSEMIAYGADVERSERPELIAPYGVCPGGYYLIVSRLVPENSLDVMLEGFRRAETARPLVVVGGANYRDAYHDRLRALAASDARVRLVGHVHDQAVLKELWCNAYAYLHGHSVGGTNPALLRAMGYGSCVLALDTRFNREALGEAGRYFTRDPESVAALVNQVERAPDAVVAMRQRAPARIAQRYSWERVTDAYERLFDAVVAERTAPVRGARARAPV